MLSVLVSCGEAAMETEGKASETVAVTETEGHGHASAKDPIRVKDSTCSLAGYMTIVVMNATACIVWIFR